MATQEKDKYFIFSFLVITKDPAAISLDLANDFPEAEEESQTRHKEPTTKTIRAEHKQSKTK